MEIKCPHCCKKDDLGEYTINELSEYSSKGIPLIYRCTCGEEINVLESIQYTPPIGGTGEHDFKNGNTKEFYKTEDRLISLKGIRGIHKYGNGSFSGSNLDITYEDGKSICIQYTNTNRASEIFEEISKELGV